MRIVSVFLWSCGDPFRFYKVVESEYLDLLQDSELCSPEGRDCIEKYSREAFGCEILCEGLYADVGKFKVEKSDQFDKIVEEYVNYKRNYITKIRFNGSAVPTFFNTKF